MIVFQGIYIVIKIVHKFQKNLKADKMLKLFIEGHFEWGYQIDFA